MVLKSGFGKTHGLATNLSKLTTDLYMLFVRENGATVAHVLSTRPLNISFRRALVDSNFFVNIGG